MKIADIAPGDFGQLRALYLLSLGVNKAGFIQPTATVPLQDIGDICVAFRADRGAMLGLFDQRQLIGFGALRHDTEAEDQAELCKLHLHPDYQGQGLGRHLVESLIHKAARLGYKTLTLHVTATQIAALGLYIRIGFKQTHRAVYIAPDGSVYDTIYMSRPVHVSLID